MTAPLYWSIGADSGATVGLALLRETRIQRGPFSRLGPLEVVETSSVRGHEEALRVIAGWVAWLEQKGRAPLIGAVERVEKVFPVKRSGVNGISSKMASALVHSTECATEIRIALRPHAETVLEVPAAQWRRALTGRGSPSDKLIADHLRALFPELGRSNAHERDAIGVARHALIWARTTEGRLALTKGKT